MSHPFSHPIARYVAKLRKLYRLLLAVESPFAVRIVATLTLMSGLINVVAVGAIAAQTIVTIRDMLQTPLGSEIPGPIGFLLTLVSAIVNLVGLLTILFSIVQIILGLLLAAFAFKSSAALLSFKSFGPSLTYASQALFLIQGFIVRLIANPYLPAEALTIGTAIHKGVWTYYALISPLFAIGLLAFTLIRHPELRQRFRRAAHSKL